MEDLISYGRVIRPVLGVVDQRGWIRYAPARWGLASPQGVLIEDFVPASTGSPAEQGGMMRGDVILEIEGQDNQVQPPVAGN